MNANENLSHQTWLAQQETKIQLEKLRQLREQKLRLATQHAANPEVNPMRLQLLLREASVVSEVISAIETNSINL